MVVFSTDRFNRSFQVAGEVPANYLPYPSVELREFSTMLLE
jgi:hypothetical protein